MKKAKTMHILHIIPSLRYGGAERMVVSLASNASPSVRHSIITLCADLPLRSELPKGTDIHVVQKKGTLSLHLFRDLEKTLRDIKPDIVHTHLSGGDIWGRMAARRIGIPILTTQHNVARDLSVPKRMVMRTLREYADLYVACSDAIKTSLQKSFHLPEAAVRVIRNGVPLDRFTAVPAVRWRTPIRLVIIGRLTEQKGHDIALRALSQIKKPWQLTIVGEGVLRATLSKQARKLGIADRVTFMSPQQDVSEILAAHDVVLMPSRWEGLGVVAMEAMAAGRPVIASDIDGLRETIHDNETGFLVWSEHERQLAERIHWVIKHEEQSLAIAAAGQVYAKTHFGVDQMVAAYEEIYRELMGNS